MVEQTGGERKDPAEASFRLWDDTGATRPAASPPVSFALSDESPAAPSDVVVREEVGGASEARGGRGPGILVPTGILAALAILTLGVSAFLCLREIDFELDVMGQFFTWATIYLCAMVLAFIVLVVAVLQARIRSRRVWAVVIAASVLVLGPLATGIGVTQGLQTVKVEAGDAAVALAQQGFVGQLLGQVLEWAPRST